MSDVLTEMPSNGDFESKDPSMVGAIGEHSPPIQSKWNNGDNLSTSKLGMMLNHMQVMTFVELLSTYVSNCHQTSIESTKRPCRQISK